MRQQSAESDLGKRLKCGEVFIWDYDSFTCAVECTLCEDRPPCSLEDFYEHIQVWHQDDWKDNESVKFESEQTHDENDVWDFDSEVGGNDEAATSKPLTPGTQPFEEVLIEIDENEENEFGFSVDDECNESEELCCIEHAGAMENALTEKTIADLSIDDLAFKNLNIQCAQIDTTNSTFESDFRHWCRKQQQQSSESVWNRAHSVDSGVENLETSSVTASPSLSVSASASDESDSFQINETNIKQQIFFGLNKSLPKPKLTKENMELLIELYRQHPRLWQLSHREHNDLEKCRQSWQEIRKKWNKLCKKKFKDIDIRIRLSTLKQRYLKERDRLKMYESDENVNPLKPEIPKRFQYYDKLKFLDEQDVEPYALQGAQINREYSKLIETYAHFPLLWNKNDAKHKDQVLREQAYEAICTALQLLGIHLSIEMVRLRLSTLKQRFRMSKIQHLKSRLKGKTFAPTFKHYDEMKYLDEHIAPYVCDVCGRIFRLFNEYQRHLDKEEHGGHEMPTADIMQEDDEDILSVESPDINESAKEWKDNLTSLTEETKQQAETETETEKECPTQMTDKPNLADVKTAATILPQKDSIQKDILHTKADENFTPEPQIETMPNASNDFDDQNPFTTLQWPNESLKDLPIIIMETTSSNQALPPIMETNFIQSTELQHLIMNSEDTLFDSAQVVFLETQNIALQPIVAQLAQSDEWTTPNKLIRHSNTDLGDSGYNNESESNKVYTNLVNLLIQDAKPSSETENIEINESDFNVLKSTVEPTIMPKNYLNNDFVQIEELGEEKSSKTPTPTISSNNLSTPSNLIDEYAEQSSNENLATNEDKSFEIQTSTICSNEFAEFNSNSEAMSLNQSIIAMKSPPPIVESTTSTFTEESNSINSDLVTDFNKLNSTDVSAGVPDSTSNKKRKTRVEITDVQILKPIEPLKIDKKMIKEDNRMLTRSSKALVANITTDNFELDVDLSMNKPTGTTARKRMPYTLTRLTEPQGHKLIELYRLNPQLWNPEHPNFASRRHKRISWRLLATQFNDAFYLNYNWFQVHRKMMDYIKYYRREQRRIKTKRNVPKWTFFEELKFLDEVSINTTGLQKRMQQREETLKIIEIYKAHPQLWDTEHGQYTKRNQRQCTIALMCSRLQEVHNITIEAAKLKQCLLELRYNYRTTKLARIEAEKRNETFEPASRFEFYDALQFLEPHLPPFNCEKCKIEFKCFSEFSVHCKKEHKQHPQQQQQLQTQYQLLANEIDGNALDNVCHICGIKFTLRQNLVQHLNRHYTERSLSCTTCDKKFFTKNALDEHQRTHTRIPAVICPECGRTFFNTSKLNQHLKRHRNQRDYPCDQCGKAFYTAFDRERHKQRHLNIRDKICPVCGRSFVAGSGYYTHIKLHNSTKEYSCAVCKREFAQYAGLYKHRKKYHP